MVLQARKFARRALGNVACVLATVLLASMGGAYAGTALEDGPLPAQCWPEGIISRTDFPFCRLLDNNYALHWSIVQQQLTFGVFVSGKVNFIGLGITNGGITGADIWMARADDAQPWLANPWHADDYWSVNATVGPVLDAQQDIELTYVEQTQTYTYVALQRPLDTCDQSQDIKVFNDTDQMLLFAYGIQFDPELWQAAAVNGVQVRLNPLGFNTTNVTNTTASYYLEMYTEDPTDLQAIPLTTNRYPVPTNVSTVYRCVDLDIGNYLDTGESNPLDYKYHVIRYGGVQTSQLFHHATLYACSQPHPQGSRRYTCGGKPPPYCASYYAIWTPSTGNVSMPKEAGLPLGANSYRYFTLVVHYSNPNPAPLPPGTPPTVDSSGIVLYLTQQAVRAYDAAVLKLGTYTGVPAGTADGAALATRSVCPAQCTASLLGGLTVPLKMFATFFRMPASGVSVQTRHTRVLDNGTETEIQPAGVRSYWNSSFQWSMTVLPQSRFLLANDSLVTECNMAYAASDVAFQLRDYCQALVMYFPATNFTDCGTYDGPGGQAATVQACGAASVMATAMMPPSDTSGSAANAAAAVAMQLNAALAAGAILTDSSAGWSLPNTSLYFEPCQQYHAPAIIPQTAAAVGTIVGVTISLVAFAYFLWARYARYDDPERQQLMEEMRTAMHADSLEDEQDHQVFLPSNGTARG